VFPYLFDEVAGRWPHAYRAACTPDFFLFDADRLVYRGQLDDSRPGNDVPVTGSDLRAALDAVLEGRPVRQGAEVRAWAATSSGSRATSRRGGAGTQAEAACGGD
jgi:hypothetical protein